MFWRQPIAYASLTDVGFRRANNQDSYAYQVCSEQDSWRNRGHLFLVADGMGGHAVGELASKLAADTIPHTFYKSDGENISEAIEHAILDANRVINERGTQNREFERMGTTCTALVLCPEGAIVGHVGDSRAYRIRNGSIEQLTFDHSLQWELIRQGVVKADEVHLHHPRNVITRCLGPESAVQVDVEGPHDVLPGDRFVLCSDGLTGHVSDEEIGCIAGSLDPRNAAKLLVHLANLRGGSDNTTVLVVHVGDAPEHESVSRLPIVQSGPTGARLAAIWGIAAGLAGGSALWILGRKLAGGVLLGLVGAVVIAFLIYLWRKRKPQEPPHNVIRTRSEQGPYRSASAKVTRKFMSSLAAMVGDLQRTSEEESWDVNGPKMQALANEAAEEVDKKRPARAMKLYCEAIDHFMKRIQDLRKNADLQNRWGRQDEDTPTTA